MPLNIDLQQILLHLLNFVILFGILYFLLYKPVKSFMDKRKAYYEEMDKKAKDDLAAAQASKAEYEEKLANVKAEMTAYKEQSLKEIAASNASLIRQAESEAEKIVSDARESLSHEHHRMLRQAQNEISDMVSEATKRLMLDAPTSDVYDAFLDAVQEDEAHE